MKMNVKKAFKKESGNQYWISVFLLLWQYYWSRNWHLANLGHINTLKFVLKNFNQNVAWDPYYFLHNEKINICELEQAILFNLDLFTSHTEIMPNNQPLIPSCTLLLSIRNLVEENYIQYFGKRVEKVHNSQYNEETIDIQSTHHTSLAFNWKAPWFIGLVVLRRVYPWPLPILTPIPSISGHNGSDSEQLSYYNMPLSGMLV